MKKLLFLTLLFSSFSLISSEDEVLDELLIEDPALVEVVDLIDAQKGQVGNRGHASRRIPMAGSDAASNPSIPTHPVRRLMLI